MLWTRHARFDEQLEVEGAGRAAFVLVANCSPYTLRGHQWRSTSFPARDFDEGLATSRP